MNKITYLFSALVVTAALSAAMPAMAKNNFKVLAQQANQGDAYAQYYLGLSYRNGIDVKRDYVKARYWYEKAAMQGFGWAQNNLGLMYYNGEGGQKNYAKAKYWFEKAAAQEHSENAWHNLGEMYAKGKGVKQDYAKAKYLYNYACKNHYRESCAAYKKLTQQGH